MEKRITYLGLDVHKATIAVAMAEGGNRREVREHGRSRIRRRLCGRWSLSWREPGRNCGFLWGWSVRIWHPAAADRTYFADDPSHRQPKPAVKHKLSATDNVGLRRHRMVRIEENVCTFWDNCGGNPQHRGALLAKPGIAEPGGIRR